MHIFLSEYISEPRDTEAPEGGYASFAFMTFQFWNMQVACAVLSGYMRDVSLRQFVLESQCCIKERVSPVLESECQYPGPATCF